MDLKSVLVDGDLFVSYWTGSDLTILCGTRRGILTTETRPLGNLGDLLAAFARRMTEESYYANFIRGKARARLAVSVTPQQPLPELVAQLASILIPASLLRACAASVRRLIVIPDANLNVIPIHLLIESAAGRPFHELFPDGVLYAPSASAYVYACAKRRRSPPERALILVGDDEDAELFVEAERVKTAISGPAEIITRKSDLAKTKNVDLLYIATHGTAPTEIGGGSGGARPAGWKLLFDHGALDAEDFFSERIRLASGSVVVLSACSVGYLVAGAAHELDGLIQSIFYAGASTILAARWPILYDTADAVFARTVEAISNDGVSPASALNDSLRDAMKRPDLAAMMSGPEASTFFWGAFALFGSGD
jgi:hypothetical protein